MPNINKSNLYNNVISKNNGDMMKITTNKIG